MPSFGWQENLITSARKMENERYFLSKLAEAIANHPALMWIDLGNEFNMYGMMIKRFSVAEEDIWLENMMGDAEKLFRRKSM